MNENSISNKSALAICLATMNGERFIEDQLESILDQTFKDFDIYISDDGSTDKTLEIIREIEGRNKARFFYLNGPKKGFAKNFFYVINLLKNKYEFIAFADQDDIWKKDKLERGLSKLQLYPYKEVPCCYSSRTEVIDSKSKKIGMSPLFKKKPCFENAIVQSIAGGNTMIINSVLAEVSAFVKDSNEIVSHDWTLYQITTALDGKFIYDIIPTVEYRQHSSNIIGSNIGILGKLRRIIMIFNGEFKKYNDINLSILESLDIPNKKNKSTLLKFKNMRGSNIFRRISIFLGFYFYRQTLSGNLALFILTILKKL